MEAKTTDYIIELEFKDDHASRCHNGDLLKLILPKGFTAEDSPKQTVIDNPGDRTIVRLEFRDKKNVPKYLEAIYQKVQEKHTELKKARSPEKRNAMRTLECLHINGLKAHTQNEQLDDPQMPIESIHNYVELNDPVVVVNIKTRLSPEGTLYTRKLGKMRIKAKGLHGALAFVPNRYGTEGLEMLSSHQELAIIRSLIARLEAIAADLEDEEQDIN